MAKASPPITDNDKRASHMKQRYEHHKSFRNLAEEFGISKSQAHREIAEAD